MRCPCQRSFLSLDDTLHLGSGVIEALRQEGHLVTSLYFDPSAELTGAIFGRANSETLGSEMLGQHRRKTAVLSEKQ